MSPEMVTEGDPYLAWQWSSPRRVRMSKVLSDRAHDGLDSDEERPLVWRDGCSWLSDGDHSAVIVDT